MVHVLGWRGSFAAVAPSTNTIVEPDFNHMAPRGVSVHIGRIFIPSQTMADDDAMHDLIRQIREDIESAVRSVMTTEPDYMVMGMSAETFWGGLDGARKFTQRLRDLCGLGVSSGAEACQAALEVYGARRIAVITPYQPVGDEQVDLFFTESGYDVVALEGLKCPNALSIARVTEDELRAAILRVDSAEVDAIVQVGTNLSMVRLADEAERWLHKPVIAINAATWWHGLRAYGIADQFDGSGGLLRDH